MLPHITDSAADIQTAECLLAGLILRRYDDGVGIEQLIVDHGVTRDVVLAMLDGWRPALGVLRGMTVTLPLT